MYQWAKVRAGQEGGLGQLVPRMSRVAPDNVAPADKRIHVAVVCQADGKGRHITRDRYNRICIIAGHILVNVAVVVGIVDVERIGIPGAVGLTVVNLFAVTSICDGPELITIIRARIYGHIPAVVRPAAAFHIHVVVSAHRFIADMVRVVAVIEIGKGGNGQGTGHC